MQEFFKKCPKCGSEKLDYTYQAAKATALIDGTVKIIDEHMFIRCMGCDFGVSTECLDSKSKEEER